MNRGPNPIAPEPFFLAGETGQLFAIFHAPRPGAPSRGAVLLVPAFAEEMNKARPVYAALARALAAGGHAVLSVDPSGTGDSGGDFADARWEQWCRDLATGLNWLRDRQPGPIAVVGLRLGAMLALELGSRHRDIVTRVILWQPVLDGEKYMTQFLRLRLAAGLASAAPKKESTATLRDALAAGHDVEIAGYPLAPGLLAAIDALRIESLAKAPGPVLAWFEVAPENDRPLTPASRRVIETWKARGLGVEARVVADQPFWALPEITPAPALVRATVDMLGAAV